jgi:hypothetical protein
MKLGGFQGSQFSEVFQPLVVFRGRSRKTIITIVTSKNKLKLKKL